MNPPAHGPNSAYGSAGVDYTALDAGKRNALTEALATSSKNPGASLPSSLKSADRLSPL
jgi:hypothetical protein